MFTKAALSIALAASLVAVWMWWSNSVLSAENDRMARDVAAYEVRAQQAEQARAVLRAHLERQEAEAADLEAALVATQAMEGSDAPLSAYERAVLDRLLRP